MVSEKLVAPHVDEREWQERRQEIMTASVAAACFGKHSFITAHELQQRKLGRLPPQKESLPMKRGRLFEPLAVAQFEAETGRRVEHIGLRVHPEHPLVGATADRKILADAENPEGILEVKVPLWQTYSKIKRYGLPEYIVVQAQLEAAVWGMDATTIAVWDTQSLELLSWSFEADKEYQDMLIAGIEDWWEQHIVKQEPVEAPQPIEKMPTPEGTVVLRADEDFALRVADYLMARDVAKEAGEIKTAARSGLLDMLPHHGTYEGGGGRVYYQRIAGSIQHAQTVTAIAGARPVDPKKLQQALVKQFGAFPGVREWDVIEIMKLIGDEIRLDLDALEVRGEPYDTIKVYRTQHEDP